MKKFIGIDIGATKIILGFFDGKKIIKKKTIATPKNRKELIEKLKKNIKNLSNSKIIKIGIGIPGILDNKRKLILKCPNLKYLNNFPLAKILEKKLKIKTSIENDANCFTFAEALLGEGKDKNIVFGLTLGSGIGSGLIIKRGSQKIKIYQGAFGTAGEIGHITIKFSGEKCSCGNLGCFESYCSSKFFERKGCSSKNLAEKARKGNKKALRIFKEYGKYLGIGLSNVINLIEPEIIVIGGGISKCSPYFLAETKKEIRNRTFSPISKKYVKIKISKLGELSGVIGAGLIADF